MASEDPWFCETLTYQFKNFGDENFGPKKKVKNVSLFYKLKDLLQNKAMSMWNISTGKMVGLSLTSKKMIQVWSIWLFVQYKASM